MYASKRVADKARREAIESALEVISKFTIGERDLLFIRLRGDVGPAFDPQGFANAINMRLKQRGIDSPVLIAYGDDMEIEKIPLERLKQLVKEVESSTTSSESQTPSGTTPDA